METRDAIEKINGHEVEDGVVHWDDATRSWWLVDIVDVVALANEIEGLEGAALADAVSLWCTTAPARELSADEADQLKGEDRHEDRQYEIVEQGFMFDLVHASSAEEALDSVDRPARVDYLAGEDDGAPMHTVWHARRVCQCEECDGECADDVASARIELA